MPKGRFRLAAGDLLAFLFAFALVREVLFLVPSTAAICLSFAVAALLAGWRLLAREQDEPLPRSFTVLVAAPLFALWAVHLSLPDVGYDTLNYHLLHGERALRGLVAIPGDFYPYFFPFLNPAPDILSALLRSALGYRLGTVGSLLAMTWIAALVYRVVARSLPAPARGAAAAATLWVVCSEGVLWETGNYMVDLYALPLLLAAALLAVSGDGDDDLSRHLPAVGLLLGTAVALKLTSLIFAAAIGLVFCVRLLGTGALRRGRPLRPWLLAGIGFVLPAAPHALYLWWTTGSPVFPLFNGTFRSTLFPPFNIVDARFGPTSFLQALVWPVASLAHVDRLSELGIPSGRLALGFLAALATLGARPRDRFLRGFAAITALSGVLWGVGTGYHRYGLFAELSGGLLLALLVIRGVRAAEAKGRLVRALAWVPVAVLLAQALFVLKLKDRHDFGGRVTGLRVPSVALSEASRSGSDRHLARHLPKEVQAAFSGIGGWVEASPKVNGLMALISPDLPMIGLQMERLLEAPVNLARLDEALRAVGGRRLGSLSFDEDAVLARSRFERWGFAVRKEQPFHLDLFSGFVSLHLVAFELTPPPPLLTTRGPAPRPLTAAQLALRRPPASDPGWREDLDLPGWMDSPADGAAVEGPLVVRGWARAPGEDLDVGILVDGEERAPSPFRRVARPDVEAAAPRLAPAGSAGFEATIPLEDVGAGGHRVQLLLRSRSGRCRHLPVIRVTVLPKGP